MTRLLVIVFILLISYQSYADLPKGFVYLKDVDATILQEMRYAGNHNFVGRPIKNYEAATCILTTEAALALKNIQTQLRKQNLSLKLYDCYRPAAAVTDFVTWSKQPSDQKMKKEFYPRVDKRLLFKEGYVAMHSGHSRGSTVDLTIVDARHLQQATYKEGQPLQHCYAPFNVRFKDNSIEMGTGYDCLDPTAFPSNRQVGQQAYANRLLLRNIMMKYGFEPYEKEWWHFSLKDEPFPNQYFDFPVR